MMRKKESLLTRIGDAVEAAKSKTREVGASLMKNAQAAEVDAKKAFGKARRTVKSKARIAEADAKRVVGKANRPGQAVGARQRAVPRPASGPS